MSTGNSATTARHHEAILADDPPLLEWHNWPLRDEPLVGMILVVSVVAAGGAVFWTTGRILWTAIACGVLLFAFIRAVLPATYRMGPRGVERIVFGRLQRIPWQAIGAVRIERNGLLLLDTAEFCPIDSLRAVYVPFAGHREAILARLEYYLAQRGAPSA
ncbi:hypothetical protein [Thermostilla marina]